MLHGLIRDANIVNTIFIIILLKNLVRLLLCVTPKDTHRRANRQREREGREGRRIWCREVGGGMEKSRVLVELLSFLNHMFVFFKVSGTNTFAPTHRSL